MKGAGSTFDVMIRSVKKLLAILLLVVVPFQFAWGAAAVYCQHEQGASVQHFGHHTHQHHNVNGKSDHIGTLSQQHKDCGYCHALSPASMSATAQTMTIPLGSIPAEPPVVSFTSHIPEGPREPDRFAA